MAFLSVFSLAIFFPELPNQLLNRRPAALSAPLRTEPLPTRHAFFPSRLQWGAHSRTEPSASLVLAPQVHMSLGSNSSFQGLLFSSRITSSLPKTHSRLRGHIIYCNTALNIFFRNTLLAGNPSVLPSTWDIDSRLLVIVCVRPLVFWPVFL